MPASAWAGFSCGPNDPAKEYPMDWYETVGGRRNVGRNRGVVRQDRYTFIATATPSRNGIMVVYQSLEP